MENTRCEDYKSVFCQNGCCPKAILKECEELRGADAIKNCNECSYYKGCADCVLFGTDRCKKNTGV